MAGCDGCTACCKIMQVRELDKPANVWCKHCRIGAGCAIYEERPHSCRTFECVWLQTQHGKNPLALELRPDTSRVVIYTTDNGNTIVLNVGPDRPDAWKHGEMGRLVARMLADGLPVLLNCGNKIEKLQ
jgi:hypothetical protein